MMRFLCAGMVSALLIFPWCLTASDTNTGTHFSALTADYAGAGLVRWNIEDNLFPHASPENPNWLALQLQDGLRLGRTLVDLDRPDLGREHRPIYLSIQRYVDDGTRVVAPADTLSIVRWVEGERTIWIRVNHPTTQWLDVGGTLSAPAPTLQVEVVLGQSAETSVFEWLFEQGMANIPYNTRQYPIDVVEPQTYAVSTLLCVDLREGGTDLVPDSATESSARIFLSVFAGAMPHINHDLQPPNLAFLTTAPTAFGGRRIILNLGSGGCVMNAVAAGGQVDTCGLPADRTAWFESNLALAIGCDYSFLVGSETRWTFAFAEETGAGFAVQVDAQGQPVDAEPQGGDSGTLLLAEDAVLQGYLGPAYAHADDLYQVGSRWFARRAQARLSAPFVTPATRLRVYVNGTAPAGSVPCTVSVFPTYRADVDPLPGYEGPDQDEFCTPTEYVGGATEVDAGVVIPCSKH